MCERGCAAPSLSKNGTDGGPEFTMAISANSNADFSELLGRENRKLRKMLYG
jgi:hypothetical protein